MEQVLSQPFKVFVDYAFTPNALEKVYQTLKPQNAKMICLLGACGGGRDKWKRQVLGEIAAKYCDEIIITNDSGPLHLGAAVGSRVISLFGPTVPEFGFAPDSNDYTRVLSRELECRPCSLHGGQKCPLKRHNCMREIKPEEVYRNIKEMLEHMPHIRKEEGSTGLKNMDT